MSGLSDGDGLNFGTGLVFQDAIGGAGLTIVVSSGATVDLTADDGATLLTADDGSTQLTGIS